MFADTQGFSPYDSLRTLFRSAPITKLLKAFFMGIVYENERSEREYAGSERSLFCELSRY